MENIDAHTKNLVELSKDYRKLFYAMSGYNNNTKNVIKYFTEDTDNYDNYMKCADELSDYFINLKSLDYSTLFSKIKMFSDHLQKCILDKFDVICAISKKYGLNTIDELLDQIVILWNKKHINDDTFKQNIILTLSSFMDKTEKVEFASKSFSQVYLDMVNDDILDPMQPVGVSGEPLYAKMPVAPEFYDANFKVISHPINWQLMSNGGVPLRYFCGDGYRFEVIMYSLKRDCCMFDDVFQFHQHSEPKALHFTNYSEFIRMSGNDNELIQRFKDYLTIPEVFDHQMELYEGHENPIGDAEIAELKPLVDSQNAKTY